MIPTPTPEASGEPLSEQRLAEMIAEYNAAATEHYGYPEQQNEFRETAAALRELQQRRAASLPPAQGGDVAAIVAEMRACLAPSNVQIIGQTLAAALSGWADLLAALDARPSPPQEVENMEAFLRAILANPHGYAALQRARETGAKWMKPTELRAQLRRLQWTACDNLRLVRPPDWSPARDLERCACGATVQQHACRVWADTLEGV